MTGIRTLVAITLAIFAAATVFVVAEVGYVGFFEQAISGWGTRLLFFDLVIALGLILVWMYRDARERGAAFAPYAALTLLFGSAGPLLYLLRR